MGIVQTSLHTPLFFSLSLLLLFLLLITKNSTLYCVVCFQRRILPVQRAPRPQGEEQPHRRLTVRRYCGGAEDFPRRSDALLGAVRRRGQHPQGARGKPYVLLQCPFPRMVLCVVSKANIPFKSEPSIAWTRPGL